MLGTVSYSGAQDYRSWDWRTHTLSYSHQVGIEPSSFILMYVMTQHNLFFVGSGRCVGKNILSGNILKRNSWPRTGRNMSHFISFELQRFTPELHISSRRVSFFRKGPRKWLFDLRNTFRNHNNMKLPVPPKCNHIFMFYLSHKTKVSPPCSPFSWKAVPIHLPLWTLRPAAIFLLPRERRGLCAPPEGPHAIKESSTSWGNLGCANGSQLRSVPLAIVLQAAAYGRGEDGGRQERWRQTNWNWGVCRLLTRFHQSNGFPWSTSPRLFLWLWQTFVDQAHTHTRPHQLWIFNSFFLFKVLQKLPKKTKHQIHQ